MLLTFAFSLLFLGQISTENVPATKVFILPIDPAMFNWTAKIGDNFSYRPSLVNAPDLPNWIEYLYSKRHKTGFLYGVPPKDQKELKIEIIGLNRRTYETRRRVIHLNVEEKPDAARNEVHLKIDNLNVEDFFDLYRTSRLLNIFKYKLWKESFFDLYFTFLTSAVSLGARLPLRPTEGEGVVIRLGSIADFSNALVDLQEEVKPLSKLHSCPRDFKRTSVERIFREEGFILDWCNFKLVRGSQDSSESGNLQEPPVDPELFSEPEWSSHTKLEITERTYSKEFMLTVFLPAMILLFLMMILSFILGYQRQGASESVAREVSTSQFSGKPLKGLSTLRTVGPERNGTPRPHISSPQTSQTITTNGLTRPTPPPYSSTPRTAVVDLRQEAEPKTWFC